MAVVGSSLSISRARSVGHTDQRVFTSAAGWRDELTFLFLHRQFRHVCGQPGGEFGGGPQSQGGDIILDATRGGGVEGMFGIAFIGLLRWREGLHSDRCRVTTSWWRGWGRAGGSTTLHTALDSPPVAASTGWSRMTNSDLDGTRGAGRKAGQGRARQRAARCGKARFWVGMQADVCD